MRVVLSQVISKRAIAAAQIIHRSRCVGVNNSAKLDKASLLTLGTIPVDSARGRAMLGKASSIIARDLIERCRHRFSPTSSSMM
jgi:hypothetical protein